MAKTHYEVLGVDQDATAEQIRSGHRLHARMYHPDRFDPRAQAAEWTRATTMLQEINEAYSVLKDPDRRRAYDRTLRGTAPPAPDPEPAAQPRTPEPAAHRSDPAPGRGAPPQRPRTSFRNVAASSLPGAFRARLLARQKGKHPGHITVPLPGGPGPVAVFLALTAPLLMGALVFQSADVVRWSAGVTRYNWAALALSALAFGWGLLAVLKVLRRPLKNAVYVTPGGITQVRDGRVSFWPLAEILSYDINPGDRSFVVVLADDRLRFPYGTPQRAHAIGELLQHASAQWNHAVDVNNDAWFLANHDLHGVNAPEDGPPVPRFELGWVHLAAFATSASAAALLGHLALGRNAQAPVAPEVARVSVDVANVRSEPRSGDNVRFQAKRGDLLVVAGPRAGDWIPVERVGATGFVSTSVVRPGSFADGLRLLRSPRAEPAPPAPAAADGS